MTLSDLISITEILTIILLGLVLGSFSTALIHRVPERRSWGLSLKKSERSCCPHCKASLSVRELIPILSYCLQKGRCRECRTLIGKTYILAELLTLLMILGVYGVYGFTAMAFILIASIPFLTALLFIDLKHMILPNNLVASVTILALVFVGEQFYSGALSLQQIGEHYILAGILYGAAVFLLGWITQKILKKETLGMGDVKFFAAAGLWLGLSAFPWFCILSGVIGLLFGAGWRIMAKTQLFPFGPALIVSLYILLILQGTQIL